MHPEEWQAVQRLLLLCFDEREAVLQLEDAVRSLRATLPTANIVLLTPFSPTELNVLQSWVSVAECELWGVRAGEGARSISPDPSALISTLQTHAFDAVIIFTEQHHSPFGLAYLCYLAGIPLRVGQSCEFGGGVLSHCVQPLLDPVSTSNYYLHLLKAVGLAVQSSSLDINAEPSTPIHS